MDAVTAFWILSALFLTTTIVATVAVVRVVAVSEENESLRQALIRANARSMT